MIRPAKVRSRTTAEWLDKHSRRVDTRVTLLLIACCVAAVMGCSDRTPTSDAYPNRPITLVVPFSAGGGTDTFARIIKKAIDDHRLLPQPLVIINQGGAGATIGSRRVKDAEADGYTMMILHDAIITAKYSGTVEYGPEAFQPIAATGEVGLVIAVREDSPFQNLTELMEHAQRRPDDLSFAANMGAVVHFAGMQLEHAYPGARFRFVQSGGGADRFADLKGGHSDLTGFSIEEFVRFRSDGLRGLAFFGPRRHSGAPDVPTAVEQGVDLASGNTFFWWFPAGVDRSKVDVIADALQRAMQTEYVKQRLEESQCEPTFARGRDVKRRLDARIAEIAKVDVREPAALPDIPKLTMWLVAVLAVGVVVQSRRQITTWLLKLLGRNEDAKPEQDPDQPETAAKPQLMSTLTFVFGLFAYVAVLMDGRAGFRVATIAFVLLIGLLLAKFRVRAIPGLVALALLLGIGCFYLFTMIFTIDLP